MISIVLAIFLSAHALDESPLRISRTIAPSQMLKSSPQASRRPQVRSMAIPA